MLCKECRTHMHVMMIGKCQECKGQTSSASYALCEPCSKKFDECQECLAPLDSADDLKGK